MFMARDSSVIDGQHQHKWFQSQLLRTAWCTIQFLNCDCHVKQECIPVGCVPPACYRTGGGLCPGRVSVGMGVSVQGGSLSGGGGVSVWWRGVSLSETPLPPCEQNHRHVQKHYFAATSLWAVISQNVL